MKKDTWLSFFIALIVLSIIIAALLVSCPPKAAAHIGNPCGLYFKMDRHAWGHYPWVMIHGPDGHTILLAVGDTTPHPIEPGSCVTIDCTAPHRGFNVGSTTWTHCGTQDPPQPVSLASGQMSEVLCANILCDCPDPGHGFLESSANDQQTEQ